MSYSIWWTLSVCDYYQASGDNSTLVQHARNVDAKLRAAAAVEGSQLLWGHNNPSEWAQVRPHIDFVGWDERIGAGFEFTDKNDEAAKLYSMLTARACVAFADALDQLPAAQRSSFAAMAATHRAAAAKIFANVRRAGPRWWSVLGFGLHSAAEAASTGLTTEQENAGMFEDVAAFTRASEICSLTNFNSYFILQGIGKMGKLDEARGMIDLCWGGMIRLGATSFWEVFDSDWLGQIEPNAPIPGFMNGRTSLDHPYASGATPWITQHLVGLRPLTPGWGEFIAQPTLRTAYSGSTATPHGRVILAGEPTAGGWRHTLTVPAATKARVVLPAWVTEISAVHVNGLAVAFDGAEVGLSLLLPRGAVQWEGHQKVVLASMLPPGRHVITLLHAAAAFDAVPPGGVLPYSEPPKYRGKALPTDKTTSGDFRPRYGDDGFVLFSPRNGSDVAQLPDYVAGLSTFDPDKLQGQSGSYAPSAADWCNDSAAAAQALHYLNSSRAALTLPADSGFVGRGLGSVVDFRHANPNNAFIDINMHSTSPVTFVGRRTVSIYLCDWPVPTGGDPKNINPNLPRTVGVVMYELPSGDKLVPLTVVENFAGGGAWVTFSLDAAGRWPSVRLRFTGIVGDGVTLSAVAFDTVS